MYTRPRSKTGTCCTIRLKKNPVCRFIIDCVEDMWLAEQTQEKYDEVRGG